MNPDVYCWGWSRDKLQQEIPWHTEYYLIIGDNRGRIRSIIEDQTGQVVTDDYVQIGGFHQRFDKDGLTRHYIVVFSDWKGDGRDMGLLGHEVLHMTFSVFKENNYPIPSNYHANDEEMFNDFFQLWMHRFVDAIVAEDKSLHLFLFDDEREHLANKINERAGCQPDPPQGETLPLRPFPQVPDVRRNLESESGPISHLEYLQARYRWGASTCCEETVAVRSEQSEGFGSGHRRSDSDAPVLATSPESRVGTDRVEYHTSP